MTLQFGSIERDGWALESGESRHAQNPQTFHIPSRTARESLSVGDGAKLLFDIEITEASRVIDRGVHRLWVVVKKRTGSLYVGVLVSEPTVAGGLTLRKGSEVLFGPEHVIAIDRPPEGYVRQEFGSTFFDS